MQAVTQSMPVGASASLAATRPIPLSAPSTASSSPLANHSAGAAAVAGAGAITGTAVTGLPGTGPSFAGKDWALFDETTTTPAIVDAIKGAQRVVNVEFFAIADAGKGAQVTSALVDAARRGVEVNVVTDLTTLVTLPLGSFQRMKRKVENAGGTVTVQSRGFLFSGFRNTALAHVDHRKVVTVDAKIGFTGGVNYAKIGDDYHDTMVRLTGLPAARLAADQLDRISRVTAGKATAVHKASVAEALNGASLVPTGRHDIRIIANAPEQQRYDLSAEYLKLIQCAQKRLMISSPGWSDQQVIEEINKAIERGVEVTIIAPGKPPLNVPVFNWVGRSHFKEFIGLGATVYEIPEVLHRKAIISDDTAIISSYNITARSRKADHELGVATTDPEFVSAVEATMRNDATRGVKLDPAKLGGVGQRIGDFLAQTAKINY